MINAIHTAVIITMICGKADRCHVTDVICPTWHREWVGGQDEKWVLFIPGRSYLAACSHENPLWQWVGQKQEQCCFLPLGAGIHLTWWRWVSELHDFWKTFLPTYDIPHKNISTQPRLCSWKSKIWKTKHVLCPHNQEGSAEMHHLAWCSHPILPPSL